MNEAKMIKTGRYMKVTLDPDTLRHTLPEVHDIGGDTGKWRATEAYINTEQKVVVYLQEETLG